MRATTDAAHEGLAFAGFEPADHQVFRIADFAKGMAALRARVTPKLAALGEALAPKLTASLGEPFFAHVAKHARRTVNTPPETWVALGRDERKYKAFAFLGVVVSGRGVDVRLVLKDEATDKRLLAEAIDRERDRLAALLATTPQLGWYLGLPGAPRRPDDPPVAVRELPAGFWDDLASSLRTKKSAQVDLGFGWPAGDPRLTGAGFERLALRGLVSLYPLYRFATRHGAWAGREARAAGHRF